MSIEIIVALILTGGTILGAVLPPLIKSNRTLGNKNGSGTLMEMQELQNQRIDRVENMQIETLRVVKDLDHQVGILQKHLYTKD